MGGVKMGKTKSASTQVFEVRLWSKKHYNTKLLAITNIFSNAQIINKKTREVIFVPNAARFLTAFEKMFRKAEKETK